MLMSESKDRNSSHSFDKFMLELKRFGEQFPNYSVGDILYSLNREVNKRGLTLLNVTNENIVELLDKAKINEKG